MKRSLRLPLLCLMVPALFAGCIESREPREVSQGYENRNRDDASAQLPSLLTPLRFGMTASEAEAAFSDHMSMGSLVNSARLLMGGQGLLRSGVECRYALKDNLLVYVVTTDPRIRIGGIGVGSSLQDVKRAFPASHLEHWLGYAWLAKVTRISWITFPFGAEPTETSKIDSMEFRPAACEL